MSTGTVFFDSSRCTGCGACQAVCKTHNDLPADPGNTPVRLGETMPSLSASTWCLVTSHESVSDTTGCSVGFNHNRCRHCHQPNCLTVCPVNAIVVKDGSVVIKQDQCIGCKECVYACPFGAIHVSETWQPGLMSKNRLESGRAYKCDNCYSTSPGSPACVQACPTGALTMDNRLRVIRIARERLKTIRKRYPDAFLYGVTEFGGLGVISLYISRKQDWGLPVQSRPMKQ